MSKRTQRERVRQTVFWSPLTSKSLLVRFWIRLPLLIGCDLFKQPWGFLLFTSHWICLLRCLRACFWLFILSLCYLFAVGWLNVDNLRGVKQYTMAAGKLFSIRGWQLFYALVNNAKKDTDSILTKISIY